MCDSAYLIAHAITYKYSTILLNLNPVNLCVVFEIIKSPNPGNSEILFFLREDAKDKR